MSESQREIDVTHLFPDQKLPEVPIPVVVNHDKRRYFLMESTDPMRDGLTVLLLSSGADPQISVEKPLGSYYHCYNTDTTCIMAALQDDTDADVMCSPSFIQQFANAQPLTIMVSMVDPPRPPVIPLPPPASTGPAPVRMSWQLIDAARKTKRNRYQAANTDEVIPRLRLISQLADYAQIQYGYLDHYLQDQQQKPMSPIEQIQIGERQADLEQTIAEGEQAGGLMRFFHENDPQRDLEMEQLARDNYLHSLINVARWTSLAKLWSDKVTETAHTKWIQDAAQAHYSTCLGVCTTVWERLIDTAPHGTAVSRQEHELLKRSIVGKQDDPEAEQIDQAQQNLIEVLSGLGIKMTKEHLWVRHDLHGAWSWLLGKLR